MPTYEGTSSGVSVSQSYFFSARGGGRGSPRRQERGGVRFLLKIPGGGGFSGGGGGFQEGCLERIGEFGGGLNILFRGRNVHQVIDLLMGLFRGAVFRHVGGARKQPIKQPTEMPTSTMALMGRFTSLMGRFPTLMGRFTDFVLRGRFAS